jgi:hypothetical protein
MQLNFKTMDILLVGLPSGFEFLVMAFFASIILASVALTIVALIDIVSNDFKGNDKIMWVILIVALNPIGLLLYFLIGRKQRLPKSVLPQ